MENTPQQVPERVVDPFFNRKGEPRKRMPPRTAWKPGQCNNPNGRPGGYRSFRLELQRRFVESGLAWEAIETALKNPKDAAFMSRWVMEYVFGKTPDRVEHSGPDGASQEIRHAMIDTEERQRRILEILNKTTA